MSSLSRLRRLRSSAPYGRASSPTAHCWPSSLLTEHLLTAPTQWAPKLYPPPARHCSLPFLPRTALSLPWPLCCAFLLQLPHLLWSSGCSSHPLTCWPVGHSLPGFSHLAAFTKAPSDQFTAKHNSILMGQVISQAGEVANNITSWGSGT